MNVTHVITRFAPSPTGALHVGGARTALFNWAYARRHSGQFLLRIEDTDRARSSVEAERGILEDLQWLGLDWDNLGDEPRQSRRLDRYNAAVDRLLAADRAYEDDGAIRFRMPGTRVTIHDKILGDVTTPADRLEDFVIRKTDGYPTYHLAVVVDDAAMGVTHVIRGQEHLGNTPKHWALQQALGIEHPAWAHIPLIFNPDGSKMSKRDKAKVARAAAEDHPIPAQRLPQVDAGLFEQFMARASDDLSVARAIADELGIQLPEIDVSDFRDSGYLPAVLCNYLALLGWNPGNDLEKFDNAFMQQHFDFDRVGKSSAKFDREKLAAFNADAIAGMSTEQFAHAVWILPTNHGKLANCGRFADEGDRLFMEFARAYQPRSRTLADPVIQGAFFLADDGAIAYDFEPKNVRKVMAKGKPNGFDTLRELRPMLADLPEDDFGTAAHELIQRLAAERQMNMGKLAQPLRVAVSGGTVTPPIDATLNILGKHSTLARIDLCLAAAPA